MNGRLRQKRSTGGAKAAMLRKEGGGGLRASNDIEKGGSGDRSKLAGGNGRIPCLAW